MNTYNEMCEKDQLIMKVLKTSEISHVLAKTNKGDLTLKLIFGEKDYRFFLDAVPMEDKENKQLIKLFDGILYTTDENPFMLKEDFEVFREEMQKLTEPKQTIDETPIVLCATDNISKIIETN